MSMQNWPEYGIGLVFTSGKRIDGKDEIEYITNAAGFEDVYDLVESMESDEHLWRYYDADMDGKSFAPFANGKDFEAEPIDMLVIWAMKGMQPFKAAYESPEKIRREFQDAVGRFLPEDFDWDAHIGEFSVSVCC